MTCLAAAVEENPTLMEGFPQVSSSHLRSCVQQICKSVIRGWHLVTSAVEVTTVTWEEADPSMRAWGGRKPLAQYLCWWHTKSLSLVRVILSFAGGLAAESESSGFRCVREVLPSRGQRSVPTLRSAASCQCWQWKVCALFYQIYFFSCIFIRLVSETLLTCESYKIEKLIMSSFKAEADGMQLNSA